MTTSNATNARHIVVGRNSDGKVFSERKSSAGAFRVMDTKVFTKAVEKAGEALRKPPKVTANK